MLLNPPDPRKSINNIYMITSTQQDIRYLHTCAGFPKVQDGSKPQGQETTQRGQEWISKTQTSVYQKNRKPKNDKFNRQEKE